MTQQEYEGVGSLEHLGNILASEKPRSIFLVTGKKSYETSGAKNSVEKIVGQYNTGAVKVIHFTEFDVNPRIEDVKKGIQIFREGNCDLVIAIGGGSVIDIAKCINILAANQEEPEQYITQKAKITLRGKKLVAVPTTSGTGSEATHFAVVYIGKTKYSLAHSEFMLPNYVILDPQLTYGLPQDIVASTGLDALSQAIEAYWSVLTTEEAKEYSRTAIPFILSNINIAASQPANLNAKQVMMKAANLAGKAINIAKTTAPHALSYTFTSHFGVPHGHAVALTLGEILYFNYLVTPESCNEKRGPEQVQETIREICQMFGIRDPQQFPAVWKQLVRDVGLEPSLEMLKVTEKDYDVIARSFNEERGKNNPRSLKYRDIIEILRKLR